MSVSSFSEDEGPRPGNSKGDRRRRPQPKTPQQKIDDFWDKYKTKAPGKGKQRTCYQFPERMTLDPRPPCSRRVLTTLL